MSVLFHHSNLPRVLSLHRLHHHSPVMFLLYIERDAVEILGVRVLNYLVVKHSLAGVAIYLIWYGRFLTEHLFKIKVPTTFRNELVLTRLTRVGRLVDLAEVAGGKVGAPGEAPRILISLFVGGRCHAVVNVVWPIYLH